MFFSKDIPHGKIPPMPLVRIIAERECRMLFLSPKYSDFKFDRAQGELSVSVRGKDGFKFVFFLPRVLPVMIFRAYFGVRCCDAEQRKDLCELVNLFNVTTVGRFTVSPSGELYWEYDIDFLTSGFKRSNLTRVCSFAEHLATLYLKQCKSVIEGDAADETEQRYIEASENIPLQDVFEKMYPHTNLSDSDSIRDATKTVNLIISMLKDAEEDDWEEEGSETQEFSGDQAFVDAANKGCIRCLPIFIRAVYMIKHIPISDPRFITDNDSDDGKDSDSCFGDDDFTVINEDSDDTVDGPDVNEQDDLF